MKKIAILSGLLAFCLSGCLTDQYGRPVTPIMKFDPNTGQLYTTYYDSTGRPVVLAPNGVFVPADQADQGAAAYADVGDVPPDPEIDPGDITSADPVYLNAHGYYFRNGHWYDGHYWRTHAYSGSVVRGPNGQIYRRGPNGRFVRGPYSLAVRKTTSTQVNKKK